MGSDGLMLPRRVDCKTFLYLYMPSISFVCATSDRVHKLSKRKNMNTIYEMITRVLKITAVCGTPKKRCINML